MTSRSQMHHAATHRQAKAAEPTTCTYSNCGCVVITSKDGPPECPKGLPRPDTFLDDEAAGEGVTFYRTPFITEEVLAKTTVPISKSQITKLLLQTLKVVFRDPVVEITETKGNLLRVRVNQGDKGPRYYNIKVSEEA